MFFWQLKKGVIEELKNECNIKNCVRWLKNIIEKKNFWWNLKNK